MLNLPYKDNEFDVVFTSGVLIHQNPKNSLIKALSEIYRVSNNFIIGLEDFAPMFQTRTYRGEEERYWQGPYHDFIQNQFPSLKPQTISHVTHNNWPRVQYVFQK